ncbi:hypothetical protein BHE74_00048118 [Ensete ventricosum]|nr:hypothetical protein GW17_00048240 [Ensete ventricosum]RWW45997.1 hypothetical protein BHE74_00048118 [Ensete ventricosum]RZS12108.1 hypothetical protein BHM03_00043501 [Ensete ventricosum]
MIATTINVDADVIDVLHYININTDVERREVGDDEVRSMLPMEASGVDLIIVESGQTTTSRAHQPFIDAVNVKGMTARRKKSISVAILESFHAYAAAHRGGRSGWNSIAAVKQVNCQLFNLFRKKNRRRRPRLRSLRLRRSKIHRSEACYLLHRHRALLLPSQSHRSEACIFFIGIAPSFFHLKATVPKHVSSSSALHLPPSVSKPLFRSMLTSSSTSHPPPSVSKLPF